MANDQDKPQQSKSASEMLRDAAAAKAQTPKTIDADVAAKQRHDEMLKKQAQEEKDSHNELLREQFPQQYQLPSAPCSLTFKDRDTGLVYKRVFPDGVARAENEHERQKLEQMVKARICYYYRGRQAQDSRQKMPDPVIPVQQG